MFIDQFKYNYSIYPDYKEEISISGLIRILYVTHIMSLIILGVLCNSKFFEKFNSEFSLIIDHKLWIITQFFDLRTCFWIPNKDYHISFFDDVMMNQNGKLQNGIQPVSCICRRVKRLAYFTFAIFCIFIFSLIGFLISK